MQAYIDPRIQKDAQLLKETITVLNSKIEEHKLALSSLEASLKEQELKLATILPYTLPPQNANMPNVSSAAKISDEEERIILRENLLNLLRIKGAMRSSIISKTLGD